MLSPNTRLLSCRWLRRLGLTTATATACFAFLTTAASADSAYIAVNDASGHPDPAAGLPRTFVVSGTTSTPKNIYIKDRAPGGAPCAPTADSDSGSWYANADGNPRFRGLNGDYAISDVLTWGGSGTAVFCIWIADGAGSIVTAITQTITFRGPGGTISAAVTPLTPAPGQQATITISGSSEAPKHVFAKIRMAGGAPCAQTYDSDTGSDLQGQDVNGDFTLTPTTTQSTAGTYVICLWLAGSGSDLTPAAGPQPMTFTVAAPKSPAPRITKSCMSAKRKRTTLTKAIATTKKALLHARAKKVRRRLISRLARERRQLKIANQNIKIICT